MEPAGHAALNSVRVSNRNGESPIILICDHASNFVPAEFDSLGLEPAEPDRHVAWDPRRRTGSRFLSAALDATLVDSRVSRLIVDCNRPLDAADLVPETQRDDRDPRKCQSGWHAVTWSRQTTGKSPDGSITPVS
jgi:predicted N-formylglutamate amidohydrolase